MFAAWKFTGLKASPRIVPLTVVGLLVVAGGCGESSTEPPRPAPVISLATTGGLAGADAQVTIDGPAGVIRGDRCANLCDWEDGDVLAQVAAEDIEALEAMFDAEDFLAGDDQDFGEECCDFFTHVLTFSRGTESRTVTGSSAKLPAAIQGLVREVTTFVDSARSAEAGN